MFAIHSFPAQSLLTRQLPPDGQPGHVPPQSTPVSPSSEIRLLQCGTTAGPTPVPASSLTANVGTEHEAAISPSTSSARSAQCFGACSGGASFEREPGLFDMRLKEGRAARGKSPKYVSTRRR